jgi:hypothetical protein
MKPGTFTQMYVQLVFAVKDRDAALKENFRERVFISKSFCFAICCLEDFRFVHFCPSRDENR